MAYSTQSDLEKLIAPAQLAQLTDDDGDGYPDAAILAEGIAQADAEIDSYLGAQYAVPVSPVPALVRNLSVAIAIWKIYTRRGIANDTRRGAYNDAVNTLRRLSDGTAVLPAAAGGEVAADAGEPEATRSEGDRTFTIGRPSTGDVGTMDNF